MICFQLGPSLAKLRRVAVLALLLFSIIANACRTRVEANDTATAITDNPASGAELPNYVQSFQDDPDPWIIVRAGAIALHRSSNQTHVLLSDQATGQTYLTTASANPDWTAGAEIDFFLRLSDQLFFEFDWFNLGNWAHQRSINLNGAVVSGGIPIEDATFTTGSQFRNYEFNLRHRVTENFTLLAGFRYIELNDSFQLYFNAPVIGLAENQTVATTNRLYGLQIGTQGVLLRSATWQLDGWVKSGAFGNSAQNNNDVTLYGMFNNPQPIQQRRSDAAFVGDLGLRLSRQLGRHLQIYGGYRLMFVDGVALAPNQFNPFSNTYSGGPLKMVTNGSPLYHGAELGLILSF